MDNKQYKNEVLEIEEQLTEVTKEKQQNEEENKELKKRICIKNLTILVLIIIIILLLLRGCGAEQSNNTVQINLDGTITTKESLVKENNIPEDNTTEKLYVTMPVVTNFTVSSKNPSITLYCPEENKGLFKITYTFINIDTEEVIYQSNPAQGGEKWEVNFKELLETGEYKVRAKLSSEYEETGKQANGTASTITITVKE